MADRPYEVLGDRIAPMLGRRKTMDRLLRHLTKPTPDHVSVIGAKHIGKTVLLKHLAEHVRAEGKLYLTSVYWDLRHGAPQTDDAFRARLAEEVAAALVPLRPDLKGARFDYDWLSTILDILDAEEQRLLVVLDGLDRILAATGITRNLWDNLRALAQKRSLRLVTGSRRRLREICASEESRTSDFWEIFHDPPLTLGPFDSGDWDDVLQPLATRRAADAGARKEIANWTGGIPVLVSALALLLLDGDGAAPVTKADVDAAAARLLAESSLLDELWDDCDEELKADLVNLAGAPLPLAQIPVNRKALLVGRGYATEGGGQLKAACRLMDAYAKSKGPAVSDLRRLFAEPASYAGNVRALIELRLAQVQGADPDLRSAVEKAVRELAAQEPEASLVWFRPIAERAFKAIWKAEAPSGKMPSAWAQALQNSASLPRDGSLPRGLGLQCHLLDQATGTADHPPLARYVTKPTCMLLDAVKAAGDFANHRQDGATVTLSQAAALCLCAVEILDALVRELPGGASSPR